jgi:hypothetical protein
METKLAAILAALVLSVGVIGTVYAQSAFALDQTGTASASDSSTNSQSASNSATATSTGSGNGNGNGNSGTGDSGNGNGNTNAHASSHQSISHHTSAEVKQKAKCNNSGNNGVSGNSC